MDLYWVKRLVQATNSIKCMTQKKIEKKTTITCPVCQHEKLEEMPTDACHFFYQCDNCRNVIRPKQGDCCVYCSYGTVKCPPMQQNRNCC